jgi:anaerobic magnesium-protoporphyrin IX monomethyl ester cyclase
MPVTSTDGNKSIIELRAKRIANRTTQNRSKQAPRTERKQCRQRFTRLTSKPWLLESYISRGGRAAVHDMRLAEKMLMENQHDRDRQVDVLFTHAYHLAHDPKQFERGQPYPPLGTLYAAAMARSHGFRVAVFDSMLQDPWAGFALALQKYRPRVVIVYEDSFNFLSKMCLLRSRDLSWQMCAKASAAGCIVMVHGSDAADNINDYLDHGAEAVLLGEGEQTVCDLLNAILRNGETSSWKIPGLAWRDAVSGQIVKTATRPQERDLSRLPLPARDLAPISAYADLWRRSSGYFSANVVASRGCPFRCNWCAKPIFGNGYSLRPAESVALEIAELKSRFGVEHVWFADDIFALNARWTQDFADAMERHDAVIPFKIQSRADLMHPDTVASLARAGCKEIWMGVESGAQSVLDSMDKGLRVEKVLSARSLLREHGIRACYFLQFGYPGEGLREIEQTIELVRSTKPDDIGVSVSYPLPNTAFYDRVGEQLGAKRNWIHSGELSMMFRSAYSTEFYRSLRNALHFEVAQEQLILERRAPQELSRLWKEVYALEAVCRTPQPTSLPIYPQVTPTTQTGCEAPDAVMTR